MAKKIPQIKLNFEDYRDRVYACWIGKNIGGTLGGPFECKREVLDVKGFTSEPGEPLPNDDLDLQLIWLHGMEQMGPKAINAASLGELWLGLIPPNWNEYGIGKNNMRRGLQAPLSGDYENSWKDSNGAWIRTEVWACMAPGAPAIAAKYAMEDAKVDHGSGEGTPAAAFVAAMQSVAFLYQDIRKCIDLALLTIPEESRMADSVRFILKCKEEGMDWLTARNAIQERNADIGDGWFEAPSNVAYALIGLLWGEGDFKKSMLTAINCGDDTDCTAATVGATLGILGGNAVIPADWKEYIGDKIITISINKGDSRTGRSVPETCTELSERVIAQAPHVLFEMQANVSFGEPMMEEGAPKYLEEQCKLLREENPLTPYTAEFESALLRATLKYDDGIDIAPMEEKNLTITIGYHWCMGDELKNLNLRWWLPEGFTMKKGRQTAILNNKNAHHTPTVTLQYTLAAGETLAPQNRCVLEIVAEGRSVPLYVPVLFLA